MIARRRGTAFLCALCLSRPIMLFVATYERSGAALYIMLGMTFFAPPDVAAAAPARQRDAGPFDVEAVDSAIPGI